VSQNKTFEILTVYLWIRQIYIHETEIINLGGLEVLATRILAVKFRSSWK